MERKYLYFTVFFSGMTTLAIEMTASRLLGSVFGTSNIVWASIIGLILIYLTIGYFFGGKIADRNPEFSVFYKILIWGGFSAGVVPFISKFILRFAADAFDQLAIGILFGSFTAVLILFIVPIILLGMVSPFAIRLAISQTENSGRTAGEIYAISTLGSFIGTFLPVLVFIPAFGTSATFLIFSISLILIASIGLWQHTSWNKALQHGLLILVLLGLWLILGKSPMKISTGQIYETESGYNYIQVQEIDGYRYLRLNEGQGTHSIYHAETIIYDGPWMQVVAAPFFNKSPHYIEDVERIAIIGLAAGTISRQATAVFGDIPIDGYEIDPEIINVGKGFFDMNQPNLNAIAEDGRWGISRSSEKYSIISLDAYRPPYIPWHLATREFFMIVRDHLLDEGVVVINVGRAPGDRRLIDGLIQTIKPLFGSIYVMDIPNTFNSIIYATAAETTLVDFYNNYVRIRDDESIHQILRASIEKVILNLQEVPDQGMVFTDDKAPIELITNNMVLNFIFSGEVETLK